MARKIADPTERLRLLSARREVATPEDIVNAEEMAQIAGITWRNLKIQIDQDPHFPIRKRGAEGSAWEFSVIDVLDHMIGQLRSKIERRDERERRKHELIGAVAEEEIPSGLTLSDFSEINRIQTDMQRRKIEQGLWIEKSRHVEVITAIFMTIQQRITAWPSKLDAAGLLPPDVRAAMKDESRTLLVDIHDALGESLAEHVRSTGGNRSRTRAVGEGRIPRKPKATRRRS